MLFFSLNFPGKPIREGHQLPNETPKVPRSRLQGVGAVLHQLRDVLVRHDVGEAPRHGGDDLNTTGSGVSPTAEGGGGCSACLSLFFWLGKPASSLFLGSCKVE